MKNIKEIVRGDDSVSLEFKSKTSEGRFGFIGGKFVSSHPILIEGGPSGAVTSVFGRSGDIEATSGDYATYYSDVVHTHVPSDITGFEVAVANTPDVIQNTSNNHTHSNKSLLDTVTASGTGKKVLMDDGIYTTDLNTQSVTTDSDLVLNQYADIDSEGSFLVVTKEGSIGVTTIDLAQTIIEDSDTLDIPLTISDSWYDCNVNLLPTTLIKKGHVDFRATCENTWIGGDAIFTFVYVIDGIREVEEHTIVVPADTTATFRYSKALISPLSPGENVTVQVKCSVSGVGTIKGSISPTEIRITEIAQDNPNWGDLIGTLSNQSDLQAELDGKVNTTFLKETLTGDDAGIICTGQLGVGTWYAPKEFIAGQGDSTTEGMAVLQTDDDITYTDITEEATSDDLSAFTFFNGTTVGKTIYIGSEFEFRGLKAKINVDGIVESANIVAEVWGGSWQPIHYMASNSNPPLQAYGNSLAQNGNSSEQWRFNYDPHNIEPTWVKNTVNGVNKYWVRFRILSPITLDPVLEQFKLHTSRFEVNADGSTEYFGKSRYKKTILSGVKNLLNNSNQSPANEIVAYAPGVAVNYTDNEFANGAVDSRCFPLNLDEGLDTSIPVEVQLSYYVKGTGTGNIEFTTSKIEVKDGFVYDGTGIEIDTITGIDPITVNSNLLRKSMTLHIDISKGEPGTAFLMLLRRDATSGNPQDTLPHNVILTHIIVNGYFWKP